MKIADMLGLKEKFSMNMNEHFSKTLDGIEKVAVAVSGGPDSLALMNLLHGWVIQQKKYLHVLTVDHNLRPESGDEAQKVADIVSAYDGATHKTLVWDHKGKLESRVQETAREVRYELISAYIKEQNIQHLFLGHHMDDQAETFLFRLAKGSGLKGLSSMSEIQPMDNGIILCRPLLNVSKAELIEYCHKFNLEYCEDPTNDLDKYARVRLRKSMEILEQEGLSAKRLAKTAQRLDRAERALDKVAAKALKVAIKDRKTGCIEMEFAAIKKEPEEIAFRIIQKAMEQLYDDNSSYGPRMEKVEALFYDLMKPEPFRKRTLGGIIFERKDNQGQKTIVLYHEQ